jgi:hypothetical protein
MPLILLSFLQLQRLPSSPGLSSVTLSLDFWQFWRTRAFGTPTVYELISFHGEDTEGSQSIVHVSRKFHRLLVLVPGVQARCSPQRLTVPI